MSKILLTRGRRQQKGTSGRGSCLYKVLEGRQSRTGQSFMKLQVSRALGTKGDEAQATARGMHSGHTGLEDGHDHKPGLYPKGRGTLRGDGRRPDDPGREEAGTILVGKMEVGPTSLAT